MVGHPNHVVKALAAGVDLICAQAGEGGGHTGDTPATILIPACVDTVKGHKSPLTGKPVYVIGAGAVFDGRSLAANLAWGAQAVWVGTRFVAATEAGAPKAHKEALLSAGYEDTVRTLIYTGRPLRVRKTPYVDEWYACCCLVHVRSLTLSAGTTTGKRKLRSCCRKALYPPIKTSNNIQRSRSRLGHGSLVAWLHLSTMSCLRNKLWTIWYQTLQRFCSRMLRLLRSSQSYSRSRFSASAHRHDIVPGIFLLNSLVLVLCST